MVDERTVLVTLGVTLALGLLAVAYLRDPLHRVLADICRKRDHARFWAASAEVLLVTVPLAFELLLIDLRTASDSPVFWILNQLRWALLGVVAAVVVVSVGVMMLGRSSTVPVYVNPQDVDDLNRLLGRVHEVRSRDAGDRLDETHGDE